jgi:ParB-like nuclease domain
MQMTLNPEQFGPAPGEVRLATTDYEGRLGDPQHLTRREEGHIPTSVLANVPGLRGEVPGEHRNRQGDRWEEFKDDIRRNGMQSPIHINVDYDKPVRIYEGSHRRDAALELGLSHVPVTIQYFGHAERQGSVHER